MRPIDSVRALTMIVALAAVSSAANADDPPRDDANDHKPTFEGDFRVGYRLLAGEGEGRFQEDQGLRDGPRLFDLNLLTTDPRAGAPFDEAQLHFSGIGDRGTDYLVSVKKRDVFDLSGGFRRDDSTYTATGDPFAYDTLRERGFVHASWTPNRDLTVRVLWDRNDRTGSSEGEGFSKIVPLQQPFVTSPQSFPQSRRFSQDIDDFTVGADWSPGIFRFGASQSVRFGETDDARSLTTTSSGVHLFDDVEESTRSKSYVTTGKAGVVLLDGKLDSTLFVTSIASPLELRADGTSLGLDADGNPLPGGFHASSQLRRSDLEWKLETSWRPHPDWEFTASGERGNLVDEETADRSAGFFSSAKPANFRITDRTARWSLDATWDAAKGLRLRAGEQHLDEELVVPTDSHFDRLQGTQLRSDAWRTTLGADWDPTKTLSISALAHHSSNDAPQTTVVAEHSDDWTLRAKWKASKEWSMTTLWRHVASGHSSDVWLAEIGQNNDPNKTIDLGSATRADSVSETASWTSGPWAVHGTATYRTFDTSADTGFVNRFVLVGPNQTRVSRKLFETVSFTGRDLIANIDVRYEIEKNLRVFADGTGTDARGDYDARWIQASIGGEYDLRKNLTAGLTLSTWRLVEYHRGADDYSTYGVEVSLTYRF